MGGGGGSGTLAVDSVDGSELIRYSATLSAAEVEQLGFGSTDVEETENDAFGETVNLAANGQSGDQLRQTLGIVATNASAIENNVAAITYRLQPSQTEAALQTGDLVRLVLANPQVARGGVGPAGAPGCAGSPGPTATCCTGTRGWRSCPARGPRWARG